ncbi:hypothetical protein CBS101457_004307 [Exobasidium rhododendri]|nr:hypothetical protein CBS101457_004307 [Exobasidium rhododendri]
MSVSLSRSPSFCSHSSSPSCSPSPHRIHSPSTIRKSNISRSRANSPLPFLLANSEKLVYLGNSAPHTEVDASHQVSDVITPALSPSSIASTSTSKATATTTPIRRSLHRGSKDAARLSKRNKFVEVDAGGTVDIGAQIMSSTPLAHSKQDLVSATWTRRRGKTAEAERLDSSSGSDQDERRITDARLGFSPDTSITEREQQISPTTRIAKASSSCATILAEEQRTLPLSRRHDVHRGVPAFLSSAHGLERNFEAKVSMTPPARLPNNFSESPFNNNGLLSYPATDARRHSIPRSHAFGPFAPLPLSLEGLSPHSKQEWRRGAAFQYKSPLGFGTLPDDSEEVENNVMKIQTNEVDRKRHARAKTEDAQKKMSKVNSTTGQNARKRAASMLKPNRNQLQMYLDDSDENDDLPPPSPSPAVDLSFTKRLTYSEGDSSTDSESEGSVLQPGARIALGKAPSHRSISSSQSKQDISSMIGFGGEIPMRSFTTTALKNSSASQSSLSTSCSSSKFSSQGSSSTLLKKSSLTATSSPYKTPHKRRAKLSASNSAPRSRTLSAAASPALTPVKSEEGCIFAGPLDGFEDYLSDRRKGKILEIRRTSIDSFVPSTPWNGNRLFSEVALPTMKSFSSPSRSKGSSVPPTSPMTSTSQRIVALNRADSSFTSPSSIGLGFDDSGVAFTSPALSSSKLTERALGKHLGLQSLGKANKSSSKSHAESPSKAAASSALNRRALSDYHTSHGHAFSVRERSALANETRMSDGCSSVASSPDGSRRSSRIMGANSVPEGLASPVRSVGPAPTTSFSTSSLAGDESMTTHLLTPQNYKNVIPLQTAFMSTGLASKRNRPSMGNVDSVTGEALAPLPSKLNYTLSINAVPGTAQPGLREVMAVANAHQATAQGKPSTMPDTPMKKSAFPAFAPPHSNKKAVPINVSNGHHNRAHPPVLSSMLLSPLKQETLDGNESSSSGGSAYGGDSPLLNQECDSPTLGLVSVAGKHSWTTATESPFHHQNSSSSFLTKDSLTISPTQSITSPEKFSTSPEILPISLESKEEQANLEESNKQDTYSKYETKRTSSLKSWSSAVMNRPSVVGLQRKGSFGPSSDQNLAVSNSTVNSPILGLNIVPTTPTRNSTSIKWFEAAQLITTPSPSHRPRGANGKRESYQIRRESYQGRRESFKNSVSNRGSRFRLGAGIWESVEADNAKTAPIIPQVFHFESRFTVQSTLGKGEFSQVDKVEDKEDGCLYAVKRMKKPYLGPRDRLRRLEEVDILNHLSQEGGHLNIIMLVDSWEEAGSLFIQTELCPCVDFSNFLQYNSNMGGSLEEARLWKVFKELSDGLAYIHEKGVLHLDLKPANVLITDIATLKIGDFGLASRWPTVDAATILKGANMGDEVNATTNTLMMKKGSNLEREGDREYIAPEIIFEGRYSRSADVYSLGLILLEAAGNVVLPDNGEAWQKLRNDDFSDVDLTTISVSLNRLVRACLQSDPDERPTAKDIQMHPVIQAVSRKVALGVHISELDQLPIFDMSNGDSSRSLLNQVRRNSDQRREEMRVEVVGVEGEKRQGNESSTADVEMKDEGVSGKEDFPFFSLQERRGSAGRFALGLLGLEGVEEESDKVLDFRGALIHESIEFLMDILEAEQDPSARLPYDPYQGNATDQKVRTKAPTAIALAASGITIPRINIEGDAEVSGATNGMSGSVGVMSHAPFRASPLRHHGEEGETDMDLDHEE